jgi:hypothetical protein
MTVENWMQMEVWKKLVHFFSFLLLSIITTKTFHVKEA